MPLTDTAIKAFKSKDKPRREFDGGGLYLEITPKGARLWRLKYRFGGKEKRLSFGVYPTVGLREAREFREQAKKLLSQGLDPGEVKKAAKAAIEAEEQERSATFEAVARDWYAKKKSAWTLGHQKKILSRLENQLFPHIGARLFSELDPADFLEAIQHAENRGVYETAHRLAQLAGQVARYARIAGHAKYDAASGLSEALAPVQTQHYASITDPKQVGYLLRALDSYQGDITIQYALRILPYVFVRSGELRGALWPEIDLDAGEWIIPANRMKMKRPHVVPLARQVVTLFRELQRITGNGAFVFPSMQSRSRPISDMGLLNALRRLGYGKEEVTVHGFRTTASTLLNEQGFRPDVIEAQLAHGEKNAIRDAYNRAQYMDERRAMMQQWADYLDGLRAATD